MRVTCPSVILLDLIGLNYEVQSTNYEIPSPHYVIFSVLLLFLFLRSKYSLHFPVP